MKKNNSIWLLLLATCSIFTSCKKDTPQSELDKLPPATQTGANTFGCLLNGKAWIAHTDCKFLCDPAFKIHYDNAGGGNISVFAKWLNNNANVDQGISFGVDSTNFHTFFSYALLGNSHIGFSFNDHNFFINSYDTLVLTSGNIILTKYDLQNGIISGTFGFSLTKPGNQIISITEGRFDYKLF